MKIKNLFILPLLAGLMLVGCKNNKSEVKPSESEVVEPSEPSEPSESSEPEEPAISYTAAEAIDAVASIMTEAFGQTVTAKHNTNGDYIVLNFGEAEADTIKGYCSYFIPEGFELVSDWAEDAFEDGTPVEYTDYLCGETVLEFLVYEVSGYEGDEAGYNGLYLQINAFLVAE